MAEVSAGQVARLGVLFERYHRALFRYFVSMNGDREQAEDLVQEVFFRMLRYREFDACEMSFSSYCLSKFKDDPFIAIPVWPSRFFRTAASASRKT